MRPEKTSRSVTNHEIVLGQAHLTQESFIYGLSEKECIPWWYEYSINHIKVLSQDVTIHPLRRPMSMLDNPLREKEREKREATVGGLNTLRSALDRTLFGLARLCSVRTLCPGRGADLKELRT
jgi:hypothetical protein